MSHLARTCRFDFNSGVAWFYSVLALDSAQMRGYAPVTKRLPGALSSLARYVRPLTSVVEQIRLLAALTQVARGAYLCQMLCILDHLCLARFSGCVFCAYVK